MRISTRLRHAWNAITSQEQVDRYSASSQYYGPSYSYRPDRTRLRISNERTIVASIYNRIAVDVASIEIRHVDQDEDERYVATRDSGLNECLTIQANIDQTGAHLIQNAVGIMFDKGCVAIVPVDTTLDPTQSGSYDIKSLRAAEITQWHPNHVTVDLYNEATGRRQEIKLPKSVVAIAENPFYAVMNEQNSTLQRLIRKLNLLDVVDEQSASGKLDLIVQLPYMIKTEQKRAQAEQRRKDIEFQLRGSQYGIAYTDGTEKVIQLNRPAENNLMNQIEYLINLLYGELGITSEVMNGTADEKTMLNYYGRTVEPILKALVGAMIRSFLTKTARTQKQSIMYFRDPFKLVPLSNLAEIADKFTRNEIATSNDMRQIIGWKPSTDPKANELRNSNMPQQSDVNVNINRQPNSQDGSQDNQDSAPSQTVS